MSNKILSIDDSSFIRESLRVALGMKNYTVILAENGKEGLQAFAEHKPDLIITDINMPELDGISFIQEIRKIDTEVPILVLTTETDTAVGKEITQTGGNGWIKKPFKPAQLLQMVEDLLDD
ncbi:MAG: response regulator [Spirochaetota bacterium]